MTTEQLVQHLSDMLHNDPMLNQSTGEYIKANYKFDESTFETDEEEEYKYYTAVNEYFLIVLAQVMVRSHIEPRKSALNFESVDSASRTLDLTK